MIPMFQVDAFANSVFRGNPAAVCVLEDKWLDKEVMQNVADENNLAETAFCLREKNASHGPLAYPSYLLRWFTPELEMDLCGHATLATAHILLTEYELDKEGVRFYSEFSGELIVKRAGENRYSMSLPRRPGVKLDINEVPKVIKDEMMIDKVREVIKARDYMLIYDNEEDVRSLNPDPATLDEVKHTLDPGGVMATAKSTLDKSVDFVSRFFSPGCSVFEDPVTGSAHCTLVPYWASKLGKTLVAKQISRRTGTLYCQDHPEQDRVTVEGEAITYLKGHIKLD